jgi:hypothetical protein
VTIRRNASGVEHARSLIERGDFVDDNRDDWSEHEPSAEAENRFIRANGWNEYRKWHLGIDDGAGEETKERYRFPYGDFVKLHRCGLMAAEVRAGQYKYRDIEVAVAHLHGLLDARRSIRSTTR